MRVSYKPNCAKCNREFKLFETIYFDGIFYSDSNECFCSNCIKTRDTSVIFSSFYVGPYSHSQENVLHLLEDYINSLSTPDADEFIKELKEIL